MSLKTFERSAGRPDRFHFVTAARPTIDTTTEVTAISLSDAYERSQPLDANGYPIYTSSELSLLIKEAVGLFCAYHTRRNSGDEYAIACHRAKQLRIFLDFYDDKDWELRMEPIDLDDEQYSIGRIYKRTEAFYAGLDAFWNHPEPRNVRLLTFRERTLDLLEAAYDGDKSAALRDVDSIHWNSMFSMPDELTRIVNIVAKRAPERDFSTWEAGEVEKLIGELNFCSQPRVFDLRRRGRVMLPQDEQPAGYLKRCYADPNRFMDAAETVCRVYGNAIVSGNLWMCFCDFALKWWVHSEPAERRRLLEAADMGEWRKALVVNLSHDKLCPCENVKKDCLLV
ncbi:hypothetical protein IWX49DRAFT_410303 [Phyllosticta citricarpa]|uniref:Uncharacterized protein n=1 Tax=Phyllosticta citricarpa TaxID=55181 RepID=A0ABR1LVA1_9PEZI